MPRFVKYDPISDAIQLIGTIDPKPVYLLGGRKKICAYDGTKIAVYDGTNIYQWFLSETLTDCKDYILTISGNTLKLYNLDGSLYKTFTLSTTPVWASLQLFNTTRRIVVLYGSNKTGAVDVLDIDTGSITTVSMYAGAPYTFSDCYDNGNCVIQAFIWKKPDGTYGYNYDILTSGLSYISCNRGHLSMKFACKIFGGAGGFSYCWEQNNALTGVDFLNWSCQSYLQDTISSSYNNPCTTGASQYVAFGNRDSGRFIVVKTDGTKVSIAPGYSFSFGYCTEYGDGTKTLCIVIDKSNNIRRVLIDRSTGTIINDKILLTLGFTPTLWKPVPF